MITSLLKGILFVIVMAFYSLCVWRVVNDYFRNEFKSYIEKDPVLRVAGGLQQQPQIASMLPAMLDQQHQHNDHSHQHQHNQPQPPPKKAQHDPAFDIFGPGINHRDPVAFREHIASINRQLDERHRKRPAVVQAVANKEQLLEHLPPDLSDQIQKAVDASFSGADSAQKPPDNGDAYKYAVMVFDNDLMAPEEEEEEANDDASRNEVNVNNDDDDEEPPHVNGRDYRIGGVEALPHGGIDEEDAFIAVPPAVTNAMNGSASTPTVGRKIISTLDGDSRHQPKPSSIIHANVVGSSSSTRMANHLLVTNDLGDGADDDGIDVDSSGDNELIMAIDGNLIKSLGTAQRSVSSATDADVDGVAIGVAAHRRALPPSIDESDGNALTEDCFCVRDEGADGD